MCTCELKNKKIYINFVNGWLSGQHWQTGDFCSFSYTKVHCFLLSINIYCFCNCKSNEGKQIKCSEFNPRIK